MFFVLCSSVACFFFFCVRFSVCARSLLIGERRDPRRFRTFARTTVVKNVLSSLLFFPFRLLGPHGNCWASRESKGWRKRNATVNCTLLGYGGVWGGRVSFKNTIPAARFFFFPHHATCLVRRFSDCIRLGL